MLAISLYQPWAILAVLGEKRNETRGYPTRVRGLVAIHATQRPAGPVCYQQPFLRALITHQFNCAYDLPTGAIVGLVKVTDCHRTEDVRPYLSDKERAFGDYTSGRYAWPLVDPVRLRYPVPMKGRQGWWRLDLQQFHQVVAALKQGDQMTTERAIDLAAVKPWRGREGDDGRPAKRRDHLDGRNLEPDPGV